MAKINIVAYGYTKAADVKDYSCVNLVGTELQLATDFEVPDGIYTTNNMYYTPSSYMPGCDAGEMNVDIYGNHDTVEVVTANFTISYSSASATYSLTVGVDFVEAYGITQITAHETLAKARLLWQYANSTNINGLLECLFTDQIQDLESAGWTMYDKNLIDWASGDRLDLIGSLVGQARSNADDALYRLFIKGKIAQNNSTGTYEDVITALKNLTNSQKVKVEELFPGSVALYSQNYIAPTEANLMLDFMQGVVAAGVRVESIEELYNTSAFCFEGGEGLGFGDITNSATGGSFLSLLAPV